MLYEHKTRFLFILRRYFQEQVTFFKKNTSTKTVFCLTYFATYLKYGVVLLKINRSYPNGVT